MMQTEDELALVSTFNLGEALFGIDTLQVQEVIPFSVLTPVYHAPDSILGILNLRGQIVTVLDLARRLEIDLDENRPANHILIVTWRGEHVGLLVDQAADVIPVDLDGLVDAPLNVSAAQRKCIQGISQAGARPVAILDVNSVLDEEENETANPGGG